MSIDSTDFGILSELAKALGIFDASGQPNPAWFGSPDQSLKSMLSDDAQRAALIAFVDEALGGAEQSTTGSRTWLPVVEIDDPDMTFGVTIDDGQADGIHIGLGLQVATSVPASQSALHIPLFRAHKEGGAAVAEPFLLGSTGGRIQLSTQIVIDDAPAVAGQARLGGLGLEVDLPSSPTDSKGPVFGLLLTDLQLPGAPAPRNVRVSADGADELDDALLDLLLALVKAQADAVSANPALVAVAGLLGLREADAVTDFPLATLPTRGVLAIADWVRGILTNAGARADWLGHMASLLGGTRTGDAVQFSLGGAADLTLSMRVDTGPSGNARLTPALSIELGSDSARVESRLDLLRIDLVTGDTLALPRFGVWAAAGSATSPILDTAGSPSARAETLRVGFALDQQRRLNLILAADQVTLGSRDYPSLDLSSPDAVMDAAGSAVEDIANELLSGLGDALGLVRSLLGLDPPSGIAAVTLGDLMRDPVEAITAYWRLVLANPTAANTILSALRSALADASEATSVVSGSGSEAEPWRLPLIGPLSLDVTVVADQVGISLGMDTSVDSLGQRCTVLRTRLAVQLAQIDLATRQASLMGAVRATLTARERGVSPPRTRMLLGESAAVVAEHVGLVLSWAPTSGLAAEVSAPGLRLETEELSAPLTLPAIGADGSVSLPNEAWDGVEALVGYLGVHLGGPLESLVKALGWAAMPRRVTADPMSRARLRLADLIADPETALRDWLPRLALSDYGEQALSLLADLFGGAGLARGEVLGTGRPHDPYRFALAPSPPELAVWFPPDGPEPVLTAAHAAIRNWRPMQPGLTVGSLAAALRRESQVATDIGALVEARDLENGLTSVIQRWVGGDGRIMPPASAPTGITLQRLGLGADQLYEQLTLPELIGRTPATTVHVALGADVFSAVPEEQLIDLTEAGLEAAMFSLPSAQTGDWYVALGLRADCLTSSSPTDSDGTPEQAERLGRVLSLMSTVSTDIAMIALAGAGHAARVAAQSSTAVTDLVMVGTPLSPISLTALQVQPTADMLRLLHRLMPQDEIEPGDEDLSLGQSLVNALMSLSTRADPAADLRPAVAPVAAPRAGLSVYALFGEVTADQVSRALTAIITAGLAERARARALEPPLPPQGVAAGVRWSITPDTSSAVRISADARLQLISVTVDDDGPSGSVAIDQGSALHVRLRIGDSIGWLSATADMELRAVSLDVMVPLDGASVGETRLTLHEARVFDQSWEALTLGTDPDSVPVLPEARVLLATGMQRLTADLGSTQSLALVSLLKALGILESGGGVVADAIDQLVLDPAGLVRQRVAAASANIGSALASLLGTTGVGIDVSGRSVRFTGGDTSTGRFGWHVDATASASGISGQVRIGAPSISLSPGGLNLLIDLDPFSASLNWVQSADHTENAALWPSPDGQQIARMGAQALPSLAAHVALEMMRGADAGARPLIDAVLDALGLLSGSAGDTDRALRPMAGLLADPVAWLESGDAIGADPAKLQTLLDAVRPLMGLNGSDGSPLPIANGVSLAAASDGSGARLSLSVDPTVWSAAGAGPRLSAGIGATLGMAVGTAPRVGLEAFVGGAGSTPGRQAVHTRIDASGVGLFLRPTVGADIPLVPFAGLGALSAAAAAALPYLLDRLAQLSGTPGQLVRTVGDAFALRSGTPAAFDAAALQAWAANPSGALLSALPSITATGLTQLASHLDAFLPTTVSATETSGALQVTVSGVSLQWRPADGRVAISATGLAVPGIDQLGLQIAISNSGLDEVQVTAGPARIDAGGVLLRPFVSISAGSAPSAGRHVMVGMSADDTHHFGLRWLLDSASMGLVASDGVIATATPTTDTTQVALRIVEVIADTVAAVAMAQTSVENLLDTEVGAQDVRFLLKGVVLDATTPSQLIDGLFDPSLLLPRVQQLFANIAGAGISINVDALNITFTTQDNRLGIQLGVTDRFSLVSGDVSLWLENDDNWITPNPPGAGGVFVGFLPATGTLRFEPSLVVNGLGIRIGKTSGPLLDSVVTLESIALHVFAAIGDSGVNSGGVQLQFSNLAVAASSAQGENSIAQGIMRDTGPTPPKPAFSPALAIQAHNGGSPKVSLTAGEGTGPWWIGIQKGFGPLYLEQIGFGTATPQGKLERISLLMDGSVSLFGLTCAVDDLQITYIVANNDFFNPSSWAVDLAGLAVSADMAGVSLAGGLLKQNTSQGLEYLGMLLGRFGVYGLTVFGGYGEGESNGDKFTSFFAIGAVNGPIGGPPAFFLTGIGGGFGINRRMVIPSDLSNFGDYPLIKALDISAKPGDPMTELRKLGDHFPMERGTFWFAAGLSFNSFALVDGIAVVGVQVGDGLDINLLGMGRMALPRPEVALVSIELALLVRFSSSEGVLWVQGQLTDNSWLLYPDIKLTGGFAYVIWFKGEKAGEFVLTIGGYHPDFSRDGYPNVPRLGIRWSIGSNIVIKAGGYFALTSEALMTGGDFEVSASFGPAWAEVKFGAHGIVYFDPFHYDVKAYARIAAGVTIDLWIFGEVTISINLGARIHVLGPDFRGKATFEVGPIELTVSFGGSGKEKKDPLGDDAFITKYLEAAPSGKARPHALMINTGALPAKAEQATPDGSAARPFVVVVEFSLTFTSTIPATTVTRTNATTATSNHEPSRSLGVAPMNEAHVTPSIVLTWRRGASNLPYPFTDAARPFGRFPAGVWGQPPDVTTRKVPKAEMIEALNELDLVCVALASGGGPEIPYYQVDIDKRKPLPFTRRSREITQQRTGALRVSNLLNEPQSVDSAFSTAQRYLSDALSPTSLATLRGERQAPPQLGTLTEGLEIAAKTTVPKVAKRPAPKVYDHFVDAPVAVGLLGSATATISAAPRARTTVSGAPRVWRIAPPNLATVKAQRSRSIAAQLVLVDTPASPKRSSDRIGRTLLATRQVPPSAIAHGATAVVARRGAPLADELHALSQALAPQQRAVGIGAVITTGQTLVLKLPNAGADAARNIKRPQLQVRGAALRVVLLKHGGRVVTDMVLGAPGGSGVAKMEVPRGVERIIAVGQVQPAARDRAAVRSAGLDGWHAGMQLPYVGWATALGPGCVVRSAGERLVLHEERAQAGWVSGAELATGVATVATAFSAAVKTIVIVLDDPAAAGDPAEARALLLGLDGATRTKDPGGQDRAPVLLAMDNRSVLAYDVVPKQGQRVQVTVASEQGWSLVGVLGSSSTDAAGAIGLITARGLDGAMQTLSAGHGHEPVARTRLRWLGPIRTLPQRQLAKAKAQGGLAVAAFERQSRQPSRGTP